MTAGHGPLPATRAGAPVRRFAASATMADVTGAEFLDLLARDAAPVEYDAPLIAARASGADTETVVALEAAKGVALQIRSELESRRRREAELTALYETASDLAALREVDDVLTAIVRRARALLQSDLAYLSLNDDEQGDTYMRVTDGSISADFRRVRLPMGAGLGGLVAQTALPYTSASYFEDERFRHTEGIDAAVQDEGLVSILGVPLQLGSRVIGVLYAANRTAKPFTRADTSLLTSLAAHAAIALDNARLLADTQAALAELKVAGEQLRGRTLSVERAAAAHDRLTAVVGRGGGIDEVAATVGEVLDGEVTVVDVQGTVLTSSVTGAPPDDAALEVLRQASAATHTVDAIGLAAAPVLAGTEPLGALGLHRATPLDEADRRILERAAMVTALLLLFRRGVADAEGRVREELLQDLLTADTPDDLRDRARTLGTDLDQPHVVAVCALTGDRSRTTQAAAHLVAGQGGLSAVHAGRLVLLLPGSDADVVARQLEAAMRSTLTDPATTGVAGPVGGPAGVVAAYGQARRVLDSLEALGRHGERAQAHELGFVGLLVGPAPDISGFVRSVVGPVLDYDAQRGTSLVETLLAFFRNGTNLARTSTDLHVHVNTVTQRLERVRVLLGDGWQEPERQLEVQLALRLNGLTRS